MVAAIGDALDVAVVEPSVDHLLGIAWADVTQDLDGHGAKFIWQ